MPDHPEPRLERASDVRLKMLEVGVCGTDREIASFDYGTAPPGSPYLVIGHESLGEVIEVGAGVSRVKPGDLVVTMVRRPCGHLDCPACAIDRPDFCLTGAFTERGINGRHGYMTEQVVDDENYMIVLSAELRQVGALLEPLTIAEKALIEVGDVQDRLPWLRATGRPPRVDVARNSNWRGPVWMPLNHLIIEALKRHHHFYEDSFRVECPAGSGREMNLLRVAEELERRVAHLFLPDATGRRPCHGDARLYQSDPYFRDLAPVPRILRRRQWARPGRQPSDRLDRAGGERHGTCGGLAR